MSLKIEFESKNSKGNCPGHVFGEGESGIIVIQEPRWGVESGILKKAEKFAKEGYMIIVPDLYRGKVAEHEDEAGHLMGGLDWAGAIQDIQGACDYLHSKGCKQVGITGFCMGGALSLLSSLNVTGLSCAVFFYGIPGAGDLTAIKIPVQGHFGDKDLAKGFSDPESVNVLEEKFKTGKVDYELYRYPEAAHAFTNQEGDHIKNYHAESATLAFARQFQFFGKYLKKIVK